MSTLQGASTGVEDSAHEKNPVTTRAALTTIQIIEDEGLVENAAAVGARALERLTDLMDRHRIVGDVRGRGFLMGVELVRDRDSKAPATEEAEQVFYRALDLGLSFKITMGNVLTLTPPLIATDGQMEQAVSILDTALTEVSTAA